MTSSFSLRCAPQRRHYEALEEFIQVMNSDDMLSRIEAGEETACQYITHLFKIIKGLPLEDFAEGIQTISTKVLRKEIPRAHLPIGGTAPVPKPKRRLVQPCMTMLCNKTNKCRTEWSRWGDFANHFRKHLDMLKQSNCLACCVATMLDEESLLKHIWETHMESVALHSQTLSYPWDPAQGFALHQPAFASSQAIPYTSYMPNQEYASTPRVYSYNPQQTNAPHNLEHSMGWFNDHNMNYQGGPEFQALVSPYAGHTISEYQQPYAGYTDDTSFGPAQFPS